MSAHLVELAMAVHLPSSSFQLVAAVGSFQISCPSNPGTFASHHFCPIANFLALPVSMGERDTTEMMGSFHSVPHFEDCSPGVVTVCLVVGKGRRQGALPE